MFNQQLITEAKKTKYLEWYEQYNFDDFIWTNEYTIKLEDHMLDVV